MQGIKHRQKVKSPQKEKEKEETKFPLAFHAEGKNHGEPTLSKLFIELLNQLRPQNWPADE